ncbi:MAG: cell wall-binding repeat-containing protein [Desulfitobacteriaceae bacterium]
MGEEGLPCQRLAGYTRYETAVEISKQGWTIADSVILSSGEVFPDALAGTTLAMLKNAPILLTAGDSLNRETLAEIKRLKAGKIYILGGTSVISGGIEKEMLKSEE